MWIVQDGYAHDWRSNSGSFTSLPFILHRSCLALLLIINERVSGTNERNVRERTRTNVGLVSSLMVRFPHINSPYYHLGIHPLELEREGGEQDDKVVKR